MLVLAKSVTGKEFLYNPKTAHQVAKKNAAKIAEILNEKNFDLKPGETWFAHEVDRYDTAYIYADSQGMTLSRNRKTVKVYRYR